MRRISDRDRSRRLGQHDIAARPQIRVRRRKGLLVEGCEIVDDLQSPSVDVLVCRSGGGVERNLDERIAVIAVDGEALGVQSRIEIAVAGLEIHEPLRIKRKRSTPLPDAAVTTVGIGIEDGAGGERRGVVAENPTVIRRVIAMAGKRHINIPVAQRDGTSLPLGQHVEFDDVLNRSVDVRRDHSRPIAGGIEHKRAAAVGDRSRRGIENRVGNHGAGERARRKVHLVQCEDVMRIGGIAVDDLLGIGDEVQETRCRVDRRRALDSICGTNVSGVVIPVGDSRDGDGGADTRFGN